MNKKYAVCVTVYKHRYTQFLKRLSEIDNKYDIYIVTQTNDPNKEDYNQYIVGENIKILTPDIGDAKQSITAISRKREYILQYMYDNNYSGYITVDDDVNFNAFTIKPEDLRPSGKTYKFNKCNFNDMLDRMVEVAEEYNAAIVGVTRWGYLGFQQPGKVNINTSLNPSQFYFVNPSLCIDNDIHYDETGYVSEDFDLVMRLLMKGINCCNVCDYMFNTTNIAMIDNENNNITDSTIWQHVSPELIRVHMYLRYHTPLKIDRHGNINQTISWKKYFNTDELPPIKDNEMYELAKTEDLDAIRNLLLSRKNG